MTSKSSQILGLLPVLDAVFRAKQTRLAKINQRITDLKTQMASLDRPHGPDLNAPATRAGADVLWDAWVQDRRKLIMKELALAARDRENERVVVAAALAKLEATRKLSARLSKADKDEATRRASW
ncbi:hypothetical protein N9O61_03700 [Octadecabacter sp.]|nr:hypothetical protein [Octadecabacter sp.]